MIGKTLSHFRIIGRLGAGGMGEVYEAEDTRLRRSVALKVLPPDLVDDPERRRRLLHEARAVAALSHTNIATVHEVDEADGVTFIAFELVQGDTLRAMIDRAGRLPVEQFLDLALQIADGLAAAHAGDIVHRDLKPRNIMVTPDGCVKLLDFGLAKSVATPHPGETGLSETETRTEGITRPGQVFGTIDYMSPEQTRGVELDSRTDLFSLGIILYEMATGRRPFEGNTAPEVFGAILNQQPEPPSRTRPDLPAELDRIILKALEKDREVRHQTAGDLRADLRRLQRDTESAAAVAGTDTARPRAGRRWIPVVVAIVLAGIAISYALWRLRPGGEPPVHRSEAPPRMTPFLAGEAQFKLPAWSPAGNLIAYVSDLSGNDDVWVSDPSGSNAINLTEDHLLVDDVPTWSPDGQRIAFWSERDGGGIYTMTSLGGNVRRWTGAQILQRMTWSRSGDLLYDARDDANDVQIFSLSGPDAEPKCLTCMLHDANGWSGDLSADGNLLVFKGLQDGPVGNLYLGDLQTGEVEILDETGCDYPQWGPGGDEILFTSIREGTMDLWSLAIDVQARRPVDRPRRLTSALEVRTFTVSPDGRRILAEKYLATSNVWTLPAELDRINRLDSGRALTSGDFRSRRPRWASSGDTFFFESTRRGSFDIWKSTDGKLVQLTDWAGYEDRPRPSPDGRWVALDVTKEQGPFTYVMRPDGTEAHIVHPDLPERFSLVCCTDWSPDGSRLAATFGRKEEGYTIGVFSMNPATGTADEIKLFELPTAGAGYPRWSPDGRFLVYGASTSGNADLWVISAAGSEARRLTSDPAREWFPTWSASLPYLYFFRGKNQDPRFAIWRLPIDENAQATGPAQLWAEPPPGRQFEIDSLDIRGNQLLTAVGARKSDLWMVELPE